MRATRLSQVAGGRQRVGVEAEEVVGGQRTAKTSREGYDLDHLSVYEAIDAAGGKPKEADC